MIKIIVPALLQILLSTTAWGGFLPPPNDPYWCYEACIAPDYHNDTECVSKCYGEAEDLGGESENTTYSPYKTINHPMGAACCSWGENIKGCMPGC